MELYSFRNFPGDNVGMNGKLETIKINANNNPNNSEYEAITHTYPLAFAKAISKTTSPDPINFIYVSGEGATTTPGTLTQHWARIKGETERDLLSTLR